MSPLLVTVLVAAGVLVLLLVAAAVYIVRAARSAQARLGAILRGERVLKMAGGANYSGKEGDAARLRGNGILVLSPTRILFTMWAPKVTLELPLSHVVGARVEGVFLGRAAKTLVVTYRNKAGAEESCGWVVPDADGWAKAVEENRGKQA
ncbi:MAG: hypothetical protein IT452_11100 [Planctomycetia bacterium]|nr:hypothetical protein [Planctomycetia bacterium]